MQHEIACCCCYWSKKDGWLTEDVFKSEEGSESYTDVLVPLSDIEKTRFISQKCNMYIYIMYIIKTTEGVHDFNLSSEHVMEGWVAIETATCRASKLLY